MIKTREALVGLVAAASLLGPAVHDAHALGLGKLRVESALDEPFRGTIDLTAVTGAEFDTLSARLGSPGDFANSGIPRSPALTLLQFDPARGSGGETLIRISSQVPFHEPYIQFLVAVEWSGGQIVRQYTALLNPPGYTVQRPSPISTPTVSATPQSPQIVAAPSPRIASVETDDWEVRRGDTLWRIAERIAPSRGASVYQMMVALYRENPQAFSNEDINLLRADSVLRVPDSATVTALSRGAAHQEFASLVAAPAPAEAVTALETPGIADEPAVEDADVPRSASAGLEDPDSAAEPASSEAVEDGVSADQRSEADVEALLRIVGADGEVQTATGNEGPSASAGEVTPDTTSQVSESIQSMQSRIAMLEEAVLSKDLENQELRDRLRVLEENFENRAAVLEIEQSEFALAQQQFADNASAMLDAQPEGETEEGVADLAPESADTAPLAQTPVPVDGEMAAAQLATSAGPTTQPDTPGSLPTVGGELNAAEMKPQAETLAAVTQPEAEGMAETMRTRAPGSMSRWRDIAGSLLGDQTKTLLAGAGVLVLGLGTLVFLRRRRERGEQGDDLVAAAMQGPYDGAPPESRIATARDAPPEPATRRIDPLAEADVYIAYGRDVEAQQVLQDALASDPDQPEVHLKLLEIHKRRGDADAFRANAREFRTRWGADQPELWQQVVRQGGGLLAADELTDVAVDSVPDEPRPAGPPPRESAASAADVPQTSQTDADTDSEVLPEVDLSERYSVDPQRADFMIDYTGQDTPDGPSAAPEPDADVSVGPETAGPAESTDNTSDPASVAWDSVGTKLDLARAYVDMGDLDYAQGLIDEVMKEGSEQQRAEAARLVEAIAAAAADDEGPGV